MASQQAAKRVKVDDDELANTIPNAYTAQHARVPGAPVTATSASAPVVLDDVEDREGQQDAKVVPMRIERMREQTTSLFIARETVILLLP